MKVAWVTSWERVCGIADYSKELWPHVSRGLEERGDEALLISLDQFPSRRKLVEKLIHEKPDVIHFQHEYGLFGGKNPPFYDFPYVIEDLKVALKGSKFIATAHTVIPEDYRYPLEGKRRWQWPVRELANTFLLEKLHKIWGSQTWGPLDQTIVHSKLQLGEVAKTRCSKVEVIPHFVPERERIAKRTSSSTTNFLVFGFFGPEKGQDLVIEAFSKLGMGSARLILAGGVRRVEDQKYLELCLKKIRKLSLSESVEVTGYLQQDQIQNCLLRADIVIAPFRNTSGSGSIAQVLSRGLPVIASDLPLNLEIAEREPGTLEFFRSEDVDDLADKMRALLNSPARVQELRQSGLRYAAALSPGRIALQHLHSYDSILQDNPQ